MTLAIDPQIAENVNACLDKRFRAYIVDYPYRGGIGPYNNIRGFHGESPFGHVLGHSWELIRVSSCALGLSDVGKEESSIP